MTTQYTEHFRLNLPDFRTGPWHDLVNDDFVTLDDILWNLYQGVDTAPWANGTHYTIGYTAIDTTDNSFWVCLVDHTSAATGTFAADRAAHPTYWNRVIVGINPRGDWANSTHYLPGDLVCDSHEQVIALCKTDHVSTASGTIRTDASKWTFVADLGQYARSASQITYSNTVSGSPSTNLQGSTDDLYAKHVSQAGLISSNTSSISTNTTNIAAANSAIAANSARISTLESAGYVTEAPNDGLFYGRSNRVWTALNTLPGGGIYVLKAGDTMSGPLVLPGAPTLPNHAATKAFVEGLIPPATPPGGSSGDIQYNNGGFFGGLTNVQVTARIQNFSSTLSGAAPASGGGTANFLRADGTWAIPPGSGGSGDVVGPAGATDGQVTLFNGTTGKLIKAAALTGILKMTSGVASVAAAGTDYAPAPPASTAILKGNGSGGFSTATAGTDYSTVAVANVGAQKVGLTAVNGSAATAMRSDAAPPIDVTIAPTWTGIHTHQHATNPVNMQDASSNAHQFKFSGTPGGYQVSYLLNATGYILGHNSSSRTFELQTNNVSRVVLGGAGNATFNTQCIAPLTTLLDGATITGWDCALGQKAKVTLGAAGRTMGAPTNIVEGTTYFLWVIQDATGSRTITTWNAAFDFGAAGAPTLTTTASKADLLTFEAITIATNLKMRYTGIAKGFG